MSVLLCRAKMYTGLVTCSPLVSHGEYAGGTDRQTDRWMDGRQTVTLRFPLDAACGQCNKFMYDIAMHSGLNVTVRCAIIIQLEARLQPNIGFSYSLLRRVLAVFTRSAITPRKVNRFG